MSFDVLDNCINSDRQQEDVPAALIEQSSSSPDPLKIFTEDGICLADGKWSMDFWDPYGLDERLRDNIATAVTHDVSGILTQPPSSVAHPSRHHIIPYQRPDAHRCLMRFGCDRPDDMEDIIPIGDGPQVNLDGRAKVNTNIAGVNNKYSITAADIASLSA